MGEINSVFSKMKEKKWGRDEWIILILAGVFLLIVFFPNSKKNSDEMKTISENNSDTIVAENFNVQVDSSYKSQMELQLKEVLKSIDGIDNVEVMITLKTSEEEVVLKETKNTQETTVEEDNLGGTREIEANNTEETVCYGGDKGEGTGPYVTYTKAPKVEGVLIVVGGKNATTLRTQIVKAVQALFDVESHKVVVIKMKEA